MWQGGPDNGRKAECRDHVITVIVIVLTFSEVIVILTEIIFSVVTVIVIELIIFVTGHNPAYIYQSAQERRYQNIEWKQPDHLR